MTSETQNFISETLRQGKRFKNYQSKIVDNQEKEIKNLIEGLETITRASDSSKPLVRQVKGVQDHVMQLNQFQRHFSSTLERYKTAHAQLMTTTQTYLKNNQTVVPGSILNKNIFVNKVTSSASSEYVGAYKDSGPPPAISPKMTGQYTHNECQIAAINNGKQYFALSQANSTTKKATCALTNDLSSAEKYGSAGANCVQGSDGYLYGGKATNALYQVPDAQFVGNYGDNPNRAMPTFANGGSRTYTYETCKQAAKSGGFSLFGLQWYSGGNNGYTQCALSNDFSQATKYGQSGSQSTNGQGQVVGGGWANAVYQTQSINKFIGCYKDKEASPAMTPSPKVIKPWAAGPQPYRGGDLVTDPTDSNKIYMRVGNPADGVIVGNSGSPPSRDSNRWQKADAAILARNSTSTDQTVDSCQQAAIASGSKYFALQGGTAGNSKCFLSNSLTESTKYGIAMPTSTFDDNKAYGNADVNAIYKVTSKGYPGNLGKSGYVDYSGLLTEYPKPMISVVNGVPSIVKSDNSCTKEFANVDSNVWQNQKKSSNMMSTTTKCGLSSAIQADQSSVDDLGKDLKEMSAYILSLIKYLETIDESVIRQMGLNRTSLNDMLSKYTSYNSQFSQYANVDVSNYDNIMADRKIVTAQQNYNYILWSGITVVMLIIALQLIKRTST
jgi:hypothetical protein